MIYGVHHISHIVAHCTREPFSRNHLMLEVKVKSTLVR